MAEKAESYSRFVSDICADVFGEAPRTVLPILQWGTFHLIFDVVDSSGTPWIVRVADGETPDFGLQLDAWAGDNLPARGVPVPRVTCLDLSRSRAPFEFAIVQRAEGTLFADIARDGPSFPGLVRSLGEIVKRLHTVAVEGFGLIASPNPPSAEIGRGSCSSWPHYLLRCFDIHVERCRTVGAISDEEAHKILRLFPQVLKRLPHRPARLLHGDLGSHNIFVRDGRVSGLIDWEDCVAGDPVYDIAFWGTFYAQDALPHFLKGYFGDQQSLEDFELRYWLYFLRVALAKTVLRDRLGYVDPPGQPAASARIQLALRHLHAII